MANLSSSLPETSSMGEAIGGVISAPPESPTAPQAASRNHSFFDSISKSTGSGEGEAGAGETASAGTEIGEMAELAVL